MIRIVNNPSIHLLLSVVLFIWNTLLGLSFANDKFGIFNFSFGIIFLFIFIIPVVTKSFEDWTNFFIVFLTFSLPIFTYTLGLWLIDVHLISDSVTFFHFLIFVLPFFLYLTFLFTHLQEYLSKFYKHFSKYSLTFKAFFIHTSLILTFAVMSWIVFTLTVNEAQFRFLTDKEYFNEKITSVTRGNPSIIDINNDFTFFHYELENKQVLILPVRHRNVMEGYEILDNATSISKKKDSPIFVLHSGKNTFSINIDKL